MFNPRTFGNSQPDGFPVLEITPIVADCRFIPLRHSVLTGRVAGPLANLTLTQTFGFSAAQSQKTIEALYRFPLPGDAAVTGVTVRFGDVEICALLKERVEAEAEYEAAKQQGRQAAMTSRESPDVFTLRVAGIRPDQDVVIQASYVQLAREETGGAWSLRVPLTTAPRYTRSDETGSRHADGQPLALLRDPGHRFSLNLRLDGATGIRSETHTLVVTDTGGTSQVTLAGGEVLPDRDLVLIWKAKTEGHRPALRLFTHAEPDAPESPLYFLAQVAPPQAKALEPMAREVILLVDHSGSMEGAKWQAADWAVIRFLSSLTERDSFALGLFHNSTRWFKDWPTSATSKTIQEAINFLKHHRDSGGTELGVALEQGLHLPFAGAGEVARTGDVSRHILLITDAEVSDAGRILRLAEEAARATPEKRRRVSVLCIDAAPNSFLATELAERGGGISRFLTSSPEAEDITTALDTMLEEWSAPVLVGMRLTVDRPNVTAAERTIWRESDLSEVDMGDLPIGRSRWVAGRIPGGAAAGSVGFSLVAGFGRQTQTIAEWREEAARYESRPEIKALFGARRVLALEFLQTADHTVEDIKDQLKRLGYDPRAILLGESSGKIYAENRREETGKVLRKLLASEALHYGLASSQTAFIAVRTEPGKPVEETAIVANALPSGWSERAFGAISGRSSLARASLASVGQPYAKPASVPTTPASGAGIGGFVRRFFVGGMAMLENPELLLQQARESVPRKGISETALFTGMPTFAGGRATLFDSRKGDPLVADTTLTRLELVFPDGAPDATILPSSLEILLYVDDLAAPRARVRLSDLIHQGGIRPLNIRRIGNAVILIVLADPDSSWSGSSAPKIVLSLS
jgi:Ca-activated chloride channel family protein